MRLTGIILAIIMLPKTLLAQQPDTFHVYFDLNIPTLNEAAQNHINQLIYKSKIPLGGNIKIVGHADYLGTEAANLTLSENRAKNVQAYLIQSFVRKEDIKLCIGNGAIAGRGKKNVTGNPDDRRVDIVINAPDVPIATGKKPSIDISHYQAGQTLRLDNIYFFAERHTIKPASQPQLQQLYQTLADNPKLKIRIEGHVCCINGFADAMDMDTDDNCICLSVNRARAIYDFLVAKGIDTTRLKYAGFGRRHPVVAIEHTQADQDKNRRVEIRILEQ